MKSAVGVIGLGIMGSAMAGNLSGAGFRVIGYDVLPSRRREHRRAGGVAANSAAEVGEQTRVVICSLPSSAALLETAAQLAATARPPRIVIETSTLPIAVKQEARRRLAARHSVLLDCPLSGTGSQARTKDIVVYASGDRRACGQVSAILNAVARAHYYVGAFGAGSKTKFVANLLVAVHNVAAAEALVLATKAGLDPRKTLKVIADGAGSSRMLQVRGPLMVKGRYGTALMKLEIWQKDMTVIGDFAREIGCPTPLFAATAPIYTAATKANGRRDTAAVYAVIEAMAGGRKNVRRAKVKVGK